MNKFWMVYVEGQRTPAKMHMSEQSAEDEAHRLASTQKLTSYVLEAKATFKVETVVKFHNKRILKANGGTNGRKNAKHATPSAEAYDEGHPASTRNEQIPF